MYGTGKMAAVDFSLSLSLSSYKKKYRLNSIDRCGGQRALHADVSGRKKADEEDGERERERERAVRIC